MTPQELKNSILQLAIQGKLVEQRPEEGTAQELYAQLQAEKQRLIKEGKLKKEKPLPEITEDEKPFEIPEGWMWVRVGDIFAHNTGKAMNGSAKKIDKAGSIRKFITTSNVYWNSFDLSTVKEMFFSDDELERCTVSKGDLLMCEGGAYYGRTAIWTYDYDICFQNHVHRLRPYGIQELLFFYHLFYFYKTNNMMKAKGTAMPGLSSQSLHQMSVPLPPLAEQKRIVSKIEELLPLIDRYEQAWTKLEDFNRRFHEDMKKSILQQAIQGKLVEQRPEEGTAQELYAQIQAEKQRLIKGGEIKRTKKLPLITEDDFPYEFPHNWKICYIDDIAFVTKLAGFEYTEYIAPALTQHGIPLFKGKNVQNGKLILNFESYIPEYVSEKLKRSQITRKCLLTPYVGTIGNIAIFDGDFKAHLGSNVGKIELLNYTSQYVMEEYVLYYLRSDIGYRQLIKRKKATAQESISIDAIRNVIIPLPPLAEQKRIVARLEEMLPLCERLK